MNQHLQEQTMLYITKLKQERENPATALAFENSRLSKRGKAKFYYQQASNTAYFNRIAQRLQRIFLTKFVAKLKKG